MANQSVSLSGLNQLVLVGGNFSDITLYNCENVIFMDCTIQNSKQSGIRLIGCKNISIAHNRISNVRSGVYAEACIGVQVYNNQMVNMQGPMPQAQFVQFNNVSGPGNKITNNRLENVFGKSNPEDAINIYMSNGTAESPILIDGNWIRGGGPSASGGGIMLGDTGGSFQTASNNILVNPGQYGIAVAGGNNMQVLTNKIFSKQQPFTNIGVYAWAQNNVSCSSVVISGNRVNWTNKAGAKNGFWQNENVTDLVEKNNNWNDGTITENILPSVF